MERLSLARGQEVLEIGAGTGLNLALLSRAVGPAGRVTLLDFSAPMLRRAIRRRRACPSTRIHLLCADATRFALKRRYDAVLFSYSLSLIPDRPAALDAALAHTAPGGRFVVLDFGLPDRLGFGGRALTRWLALHNVTPCHEEVDAFGRARLGDFRLDLLRGGYNMIASGRAAG